MSNHAFLIKEATEALELAQMNLRDIYRTGDDPTKTTLQPIIQIIQRTQDTLEALHLTAHSNQQT